jgi:hypothetical protein
MSSPPYPRRARLGISLLLALLLLGGCSTRKPDPTSYGNTTRTNFLKGCEEKAKDPSNMSATEAEAYCKCSYAAIVDQIPFAEFKKINSDLSEHPDQLPEKMLKIRDDCLAAG